MEPHSANIILYFIMCVLHNNTYGAAQQYLFGLHRWNQRTSAVEGWFWTRTSSTHYIIKLLYNLFGNIISVRFPMWRLYVLWTSVQWVLYNNMCTIKKYNCRENDNNIIHSCGSAQIRRCELTRLTRHNKVYTIHYYILRYLCNGEINRLDDTQI